MIKKCNILDIFGAIFDPKTLGLWGLDKFWLKNRSNLELPFCSWKYHFANFWVADFCEKLEGFGRFLLPRKNYFDSRCLDSLFANRENTQFYFRKFAKILVCSNSLGSDGSFFHEGLVGILTCFGAFYSSKCVHFGRILRQKCPNLDGFETKLTKNDHFGVGHFDQFWSSWPLLRLFVQKWPKKWIHFWKMNHFSEKWYTLFQKVNTTFEKVNPLFQKWYHFRKSGITFQTGTHFWIKWGITFPKSDNHFWKMNFTFQKVSTSLGLEQFQTLKKSSPNP